MGTTETISATEYPTVAYEVYARINPHLRQHHDGEYVAIDELTGDYVIGRTDREALTKARDRFSEHPSFLMRIGADRTIGAFTSRIRLVGSVDLV